MSTAARSDTPKAQPVVRAATASRMPIGVALGGVSAAMLILAFPPYNAWPLIFVAFVPMVLADNRVLPLRRAGLASAIGIGVWLLVYLTMIFGLSMDTWFMQAIAVLVGMFGYLSGRGLRSFHEATRYRWFVLSGIVGIVGVEMIRSFIPIIATHAFVGHAVHTQPWLIQPVSIFSIYGLDVLIMLVNSTLGLAALGLFDRKWHWDELPAVDGRMNKRWLAGASVAVAAWIGLNLVIVARGPTNGPEGQVAGGRKSSAWTGPSSKATRCTISSPTCGVSAILS